MKCSQFASLLLLLFTLSFFSSCDDDEILPAVRREFGLFQNKPDISPPLFKCDNGKTYYVKDVPSTIPDGATVRCLLFFYPELSNNKDYAIILGNPAFISMYNPIQLADSNIVTDPIKLESIWKEGLFINYNMWIRTADKDHVLGLIDKGITTNDSGNRILHILLYHDNEDDNYAFSKNYYISFPVSYYSDTLRINSDSIYCTVNTEKYGFRTWKFPY